MYQQQQARGGYGGGRGGGGAGRGGGFRGGRGGGPGGPRAPPTFQSVSIQPAPIIPADAIEVIAKETPDVTVNCYRYKTNSLVPVYKYELVFIVKHKTGNERVVTDRLRTDHDKVMVKNAVTTMYDKLLTVYDAVFHLSDRNAVHVYDRIKDYYSSVCIPERTFDIDVNLFSEELLCVLRKPVQITASIKPVKEINPGQENLSVEDKIDVELYLDCLVSQTQLDQPRFYVFGANVYDKSAKKQLDELELLDGHHKINKVMDNQTGILQLEPKRAAFYPSGCALLFASKALNFDPSVNICQAPYPERLTNLLKGMMVGTKYHKFPRRFEVYEVTSKSAQDIVIEGSNQTVADYITGTYNYQLQFPHYPCVVEKKGQLLNYYPIETVAVCEAQRVSRGRFTKKQNTDMIKQCQQVPAVFLDNMVKETQKSQIDSSNAYYGAAGLSVHNEMIVAKGKIMHAPQIQYAGTAKDLGFGEWRFDHQDRFVRGGVINNLLFVSYEVNEQVCRTFADQLVRRGKEAGMVINKYSLEPLRYFHYEEIVRFMEAKRDKSQIDFLFVIGDVPGLHDNLKAAEQKTGLNTEQVKGKTVERTGGSTFENILMKLNLKVGGQNQNLGTSPAQLRGMKNPCDIHKSLFENTLCMGFNIAHPGSRNGFEMASRNSHEPSVFGYSFTTTSSANVTLGGYVYIRPRQTILDKCQLEGPLNHALSSYLERRGKFPERIVIFRGSASEADFQRLNEYEAIGIGRIIREFLNGRDDCKMPSFAMVTISKKHNFRLLKPKAVINPQDKAPNQNVVPGTLIDHTITNEGFDQFVFVAHKSLQGCGKPVVATVVTQRGTKLETEIIQQMTYNMCYHHEIVPLSISVPAPIRSAEQLANRGQRNIITMGNGSLSGLSDSNENDSYLNEFYLRLTAKYATRNSHRFWA